MNQKIGWTLRKNRRALLRLFWACLVNRHVSWKEPDLEKGAQYKLMLIHVTERFRYAWTLVDSVMGDSLEGDSELETPATTVTLMVFCYTKFPLGFVWIGLV